MNLTSPRYSLVVMQVSALIYAFMLHLNALGSNLACRIPLSLVPKSV